MRFGDAPGGPQVFEMEEEELRLAMQRYQIWMREEATNFEDFED